MEQPRYVGVDLAGPARGPAWLCSTTLPARVISLCSLTGGALVAATGHGLIPLWIAIGGLIVAAVGEMTQSAITGRRRPVLSDLAHGVDLQMRTFA